MEADVSHDRRDDRVVGQLALLHHVHRAHDEDVVAVDDLALLVDAEAAVGVAIMRDAEVRAVLEDSLLQGLEMRRAAAVVDVRAIRQRVDDLDIGTEAAQDFRHCLVGSAVGTVEHDLDAVEALLAGREHEFHVLVEKVRAVLDVADVLCRRARVVVVRLELVHDGLELILDGIRQLVAIAAEELDAVVVERVVRGRDDDARLGLVLAREVGDGRRRDDAREHGAAACRADAGRQRRLEHLARDARVAADDDERLLLRLLAEVDRRCAAETVGHLRQQRHVCLSADTVRTE